MIKIELHATKISASLDRLLARGANLKPAFASIGELVAESTKTRFSVGQSPDGDTWAPNSPRTIAKYLEQKSGLFDKISGKRVGTKKGYFSKKDGRLTKKGAAIVAAKKPLHGISGMLADQIFYNVVADGVEIGSPMIYSAIQQFGGRKSDFPHLWGDIPPRPFLGISRFDERDILDVVEEFLISF